MYEKPKISPSFLRDTLTISCGIYKFKLYELIMQNKSCTELINNILNFEYFHFLSFGLYEHGNSADLKVYFELLSNLNVRKVAAVHYN